MNLFALYDLKKENGGSVWKTAAEGCGVGWGGGGGGGGGWGVATGKPKQTMKTSGTSNFGSTSLQLRSHSFSGFHRDGQPFLYVFAQIHSAHFYTGKEINRSSKVLYGILFNTL